MISPSGTSTGIYHRPADFMNNLKCNSQIDWLRFENQLGKCYSQKYCYSIWFIRQCCLCWCPGDIPQVSSNSNHAVNRTWQQSPGPLPMPQHFPHFWPFVRGIHQSQLDSLHKGQWCRALMLSLIFASTKSWANNRDAGDLRSQHAHYNVTVMYQWLTIKLQ